MTAEQAGTCEWIVNMETRQLCGAVSDGTYRTKALCGEHHRAYWQLIDSHKPNKARARLGLSAETTQVAK